MNKLDFINRLRTALTGRLAAEQVQDHVNYYEDYINTQIRMGQSEDAVLASLGDPRLIAKTIIDASGVSDFEDIDYQSEGYRNSVYQSQGSVYIKERKAIHLPGWLWAVIVILVLILVLGLVFTLLSAFAPLIVVMLVVVGLMKFFDWLN